jgi:hypothetical protein
MFRWNDSRRPQLQFEGHAQNNPILIERCCDACGLRSTETEPLYPPGPPVVPGTGSEIPPFVCIDFRNCCLRYRKGLSPDAFGAMVRELARVHFMNNLFGERL